ncbi:hypothetical protein YC2023_066481 [Brassica napus]
MAGMKSEIEKFDGDGDFSLWKRRMYAFLSVSGLKDVLIEKTKVEEDSEEDEKDFEKKKKIAEAEIARSERCEKAMNIIFLNVGDHVLRKIERCTTAAETWILLEKLYMPKSLPNRIHAQLRLYSFKMQENRSVDDNIDEFLKIIGDLSNLNIEVPEEVDEVASSARSKEKELKDVVGSRSSSEGHFVRGRSENRSSQNGNGRKKSFRSRNKHRNQSERGESSLVKDDAHDLVGLIAAEIVLGCTLIMRGYRKGSDTLYFMRGSALRSGSGLGELSAAVSDKDQTQLWHSRLGHVGKKGLEMLVKKGCIPSEHVSEMKFCEDCVKGTEDDVSQGGAVQERGQVTPVETEDQEDETGSEDTPPATETDDGYQLARDRTRRTLKPPAKLQDYHEGYILKVLGNFKMEQAKIVGIPMGTHFALRAATEIELRDQAEAMKKVPYQSAVGNLMYSMICTRPDLAFAVGLVCRYMSKPVKDHWLAVKWLLRYLRGSVKIRLVFRKEGEFTVQGYCDADYAGDADKRRSTTGMVFTVGGSYGVSNKNEVEGGADKEQGGVLK